MKQVFTLATQVDFDCKYKFLWKNIVKSHTIIYKKIMLLAESEKEAVKLYKEKYFTKTPKDIYYWDSNYEGYSVDINKMINPVYDLVSYSTEDLTIEGLKKYMTAEDFRKWFWEGINYDM